MDRAAGIILYIIILRLLHSQLDCLCHLNYETIVMVPLYLESVLVLGISANCV